MPRNKPRSYFEPWTPKRDSGAENSFIRPPNHGDTPEEVAQNVRDWEGSREKAIENAAWWIYATGVHEPEVTNSLLGTIAVHDGSAILARFNKVPSPPDGAPSQEDIAKRACACVNACRGIASPGPLIEELRGLLLDLARGLTSGEDMRVVSCLGRMIPPEQLKEFEEFE